MTADPREALAAWRASTGYSQNEVGALFGVVKSAVGHWERGRVAIPLQVQRRLRAEGWLCYSSGWPRWTADEDTWLLAHAGQWPLPELARRVGLVYGVPRTPLAVATRLRLLGASIGVRDLLSRTQVARFCGVAGSTVTVWAERGWLPLPAWARRGRRGQWAVTAAALHAFIETHAVQLDVARMRPSPYRDHAAAVWTRERWLTSDQVCTHIGISRHQLGALVATGALPAVRRMRRGIYWWMIRARDLAAFVRQREAA